MTAGQAVLVRGPGSASSAPGVVREVQPNGWLLVHYRNGAQVAVPASWVHPADRPTTK